MNYNDGKVHLDVFDKDNINEIAKQFSEGSVMLEECLLEMWSKGLLTQGCCKGEHDPYFEISNIDGNAYIVVQEGIDMFSFLSTELIQSEYVNIKNVYGKQSIYFYGPNKNELLKVFKEDILSGKKDNSHLIENKLKEEIKPEIYEESFISNMKLHHYHEEDIEKMLPYIKFIFAMDYNWNNAETEKYYSYINILNVLIKDAYNNKLEDTMDDPLWRDELQNVSER